VNAQTKQATAAVCHPSAEHNSMQQRPQSLYALRKTNTDGK